MPTINISLRVVQRSVEEFTDILAKNPGLWINVVDRKNNPVFVAKLPGHSDIQPYILSDMKESELKHFADIVSHGKGDTYQIDPVETLVGEDLLVVHKKPTRQELQQKIDAITGKKPMYTEIEPEQYDGEGEVEVVNVYTERWHCEKCKKPAECRKMFEEGIDHIVCEECAKKAKLNWNKLEKP